MFQTFLYGGEKLEDWKIKIAVLWLFSLMAFLGFMILTFIKPGIIEQVIAGEIEGMKVGQEFLLLYAIIILFPLVMAFLSLTLKDSINRWLNLIMGTVAVVLSLVGLSGNLAQPYAYAILIWISKVLVDALIVWYAWKSKQKA